MKVIRNYPLKDINAFKFDIKADYFIKVKTLKDIEDIARNKRLKALKTYILGLGTNTLFTKDFNGLVIKIEIEGRSIVSETRSFVIIEVGAGEEWRKIVNHCLKKGWYGIENLSYIPGTVGAACVQNIAAYDQNFSSVFNSLTAYDLKTGRLDKLSKKQCGFEYRRSVFKKSKFSKYIITNVRMKLSKIPHLTLGYYSRYESIAGELTKFASPPYKPQDVSKAVIRIRKSKFPDWRKHGTAGSFFLNPIVSKKKLRGLQKKFPTIQYYPVNQLNYPKLGNSLFKHTNFVKIPAGWLLEELGWRDKKIGNIGTSPNQSLVVINYGNGTPKELLKFTEKMMKDIKDSFQIHLEPEVNIV